MPAAGYAEAPRRATALIDGVEDAALTAVLARIAELAAANRYETAARLRDHAAAAIDVLWRGQRLRALAAVTETGRGAPDGSGGWHLAVIRRGQLAAAGVAPPRRAADAGGRRDKRWRHKRSCPPRRRWAARWSRRSG